MQTTRLLRFFLPVLWAFVLLTLVVACPASEPPLSEEEPPVQADTHAKDAGPSEPIPDLSEVVPDAPSELPASPDSSTPPEPTPEPPSDRPVQRRHGLILGEPVAEGISMDKLQFLLNKGKQELSSAVIVLKNGKLVVEEYYGNKDEPLIAMSVSKSFVNLAIGLLFREKKLTSLDMKMADVFKEWVGTPKEVITLRQMMNHTSGIETERTHVVQQNGQWVPGHISDGLNGPLISTPGKVFLYNNRAADLLALFVGRVVGKSMDLYLQEKLLVPLNITTASWLKDADGVPRGAGEFLIRPVDLAKVGLLLLQKGTWEGQRILDEDWIQQSWAQGQALSPLCGLLWWRRPASIEYELTEDILKEWEAFGVSKSYTDKLRGLLGKKMSRTDYINALRQALNNNAALNQIDAALNKGARLGILHPVGRFLYSAEGWLGQYLVLDPDHQLVAVRMRKPTQADYESSQTKNDYLDFLDRVRDLPATP